MKSGVDLGAGYILKWFTSLQITSLSSSSNHPIATQLELGVKLTTFQSYVQGPYH